MIERVNSRKPYVYMLENWSFTCGANSWVVDPQGYLQALPYQDWLSQLVTVNVTEVILIKTNKL